MVLRFTNQVLFCTLILVYGLGDAVNDDDLHHHHHHIESAEVGLFTMDELLSFHLGKKLPIFFPIRDLSLYPPLFLPPKLAQIIPFSISQASTILKLFPSVPPSSPNGKAFLGTLKSCESIGGSGTKICATSKHSMLSFVKEAFGSPEVDDFDFKFITTTHPTITTPLFQDYTVLEPPLEIQSTKKVPCHPIPYFYAVYFCHKDPDYSIRAFKLRLVGDSSGDKVEAVVVCHLNTKNLSSEHIAIRMLGIEKGNPYCHVFRQGDIVWIQNHTSDIAAM